MSPYLIRLSHFHKALLHLGFLTSESFFTEANVLPEEGEAYATKLREAGVPVTAVRFQGIIHDFVMLNALAKTEAARGAIDLATTWLRKGF